ncbi:hypothetical protein Air01nite_79360 [Asanoa iriomotensis]|uniref:Uncharacterized protein n=1 Tax=Asanoa iriomotensis TaxID=234613 RepID=A0ABQ4CH76_9ACTN|nr:hypothetical protein Air01nite_79360 [Asanoa iriomotensis]
MLPSHSQACGPCPGLGRTRAWGPSLLASAAPPQRVRGSTGTSRLRFRPVTPRCDQAEAAQPKKSSLNHKLQGDDASSQQEVAKWGNSPPRGTTAPPENGEGPSPTGQAFAKKQTQ